MNILLTGATGFIGKNLLKQIEKQEIFKNSKIYIITRNPEKLPQINTLNLIILRTKSYNYSKELFQKKIDEIDVVIHLGSNTPKSQGEADNIELSNCNVTSTYSLINNLPTPPKKFLFASTLDVYKNANKKIHEKSLIVPISFYGYSKLYCEKMLEIWAEKNNVLLQVCRIGHIYGEGEEEYSKIIPTVIRKIINNDQPQIYGSGNEFRSFLYVGDLTSYLIKIFNLNFSISPINLVSSQSYKITEVVDTIIGISKKNIKPKRVDFFKPKRDLLFDTTKLDKTIGERETSIFDGLRNEYNYMLDLFQHAQN
ncbi:NAD-dependent epimerase/dehydratase family protein [Bacteroidota bacterium]